MAARHRTAKSVKDVYRGYVPEGLPQNKPPIKTKYWWKVLGKPMVTIYPRQEIDGFSEEPEYPPLNDGSKKGLSTQVRLNWYDELKKIPTAEQKLFEINRHSNHYIAHIFNWLPRYNSLPMAKYLTRTHLIEGTLPDRYRLVRNEDMSETTDPSLASDIGYNEERFNHLKQALLDQIALDKYESIKKGPNFVTKTNLLDGNKKVYVANRLVQNLINIVKRSLILEPNSELMNYQYDLEPFLRSWWYHSGFKPPNNKVFYKSRKDDDGNINQIIQILAGPAMQIRANNFLEPVIEQTDSMVTDSTLVENFNHPLKFYRARYSFKKPVSSAGFWFEDTPEFDFPHTCFLTTECLKLRNDSKPHQTPKYIDDDENCLNTQAVLTGFGWTNSLSMYHGFTPFQELEYPFTCQLVTTDGQNWVFNVYQLNSHSFHRDIDHEKKNNICWSSGLMQLYKEYADGQFLQVNDDVLRLLIKFLTQKTSPSYTSQLNLRPYVNIEDDFRTDEEKAHLREKLEILSRRHGNRWMLSDWRVPLWEHIFFRHKAIRNKITHMKPRWHIPKPKYPRIFE